MLCINMMVLNNGPVKFGSGSCEGGLWNVMGGKVDVKKKIVVRRFIIIVFLGTKSVTLCPSMGMACKLMGCKVLCGKDMTYVLTDRGFLLNNKRSKDQSEATDGDLGTFCTHNHVAMGH